MQLGAWLQSQGYLDDAPLAEALQLQQRWGGKLGEVLLATRAISPLMWLQALKAQSQQALSLEQSPPDASLMNQEDLTHYIAQSFIPHHTAGTTLIIATPNASDTLQAWCEAHYRMPCQCVLITAREHHQFLQRYFATTLNSTARERLLDEHPALSALIPIWKRQKHGLWLIGALLATCLIAAPVATWYAAVTITSLFYCATLLFKIALLTSVPTTNSRHRIWHEEAGKLSDASLPVYSILVPFYKEPANVVRQILSAIHKLDYPKTKLDVWLITEADDEETYQNTLAACPPDYCRILRVPPSHPRTKPKACNVALPLVRGEFVTIYDAEDMPSPDQLKLAVAAFQSSSPKLACVQAALNYYNRDENLLTKLFAIEYSALFTMFLPALRLLRIPIPLGGTSNHLRTSILREVGGWDPYNVTEDADLGVRLSYFGYRTDVLPALTLEESPITLKPWLNQRSRWIKGYVQTWLVYMRDPLALLARLGPGAFFGFQLFVGAPALTFLLAPIFWTISLALILGAAPNLHLPLWLLACCFATFSLGIIIQWVTAARVIEREKWGNMSLALLVFPLYWLLHSVACIKAMWQLVKKPHFWEKTSHGKSRFFTQNLA